MLRGNKKGPFNVASATIEEPILLGMFSGSPLSLQHSFNINAIRARTFFRCISGY
jgi:hypothetical protein